jgi:hypothetical protein
MSGKLEKLMQERIEENKAEKSIVFAIKSMNL